MRDNRTLRDHAIEYHEFYRGKFGFNLGKIGI